LSSVPEVLAATDEPTGRIRSRTSEGRKTLEPISPSKFVGVVAACMGLSALSIDLGLPAFADIRSEFGLGADSTQV
jgi:hypothetical protein